MTAKHFTRREFLTRAPASAAAVGLAGCGGGRPEENAQGCTRGDLGKTAGSKGQGQPAQSHPARRGHLFAPTTWPATGKPGGLPQPQRLRPGQRHLRGGLPGGPADGSHSAET